MARFVTALNRSLCTPVMQADVAERHPALPFRVVSEDVAAEVIKEHVVALL